MNTQKGNALLYVLIGIALLASLTYAISKDGGGQQQNQLSAAQVKLLATDLIKHATEAEMAVHQMTQWGLTYDQILFDLPGTAGYSTNVSRQLYHPSGGGVSVFDTNKGHFKDSGTSQPAYGWQGKSKTNVEWTSTNAIDAIYTAGNIENKVCAEINLQLTGSSDVPTVSDSFAFHRHFTNNFPYDADFLSAECPECIAKKSFCFRRDNGDWHAFYTVIGAR